VKISKENIFSARFRSRVRQYCLTLAIGMAGCSSPASNEPYTNLKLNEIRQAPGGQLALIYNEKHGRPPGQRVFLANAKEIDRDLSVALDDMKKNQGYGETFAGGVILHRRKAADGVSPDIYWMQLDPFELTGDWTPPLSEPASSAEAVAQSLPLQPAPPSANSTQPSSTLATNSLPELRAKPAQPDQHFLWQTASGPVDTTVSAQPLIGVNPHNNFLDRTGQVIGGGLLLTAFGAGLALAVIGDLHDHCYPHPFYHP